MVGADHGSAQEIRDKVGRVAGSPWFAVSPLMHAAGMWTAFSAIMAGLTVVLYDTSNRLDPRLVWETAERESVADDDDGRRRVRRTAGRRVATRQL